MLLLQFHQITGSHHFAFRTNLCHVFSLQGCLHRGDGVAFAHLLADREFNGVSTSSAIHSNLLLLSVRMS